MTVRKWVTWNVFILIICIVQSDNNRWSRQISNNDWIPVANPHNSKKSQSHISIPAMKISSSDQSLDQVSILSLPLGLQQQYQDQLLQLQRTQESIQRLLLLQEQLKTQQQLLQTQVYQHNGFTNTDDEKQALHQSTIINLQTLPVLAPEVFVQSHPSSKTLPTVFQSQDYHSSNSNLKLDQKNQNQYLISDLPNKSEQEYPKFHDESTSYGNRQDNIENLNTSRQKSRYDDTSSYKEQTPHVSFVTPAMNSGQEPSEKQEEIQLVYVPAETLVQRGQMKRHRFQTEKHNPSRDEQNHVETPSISLTSHDAYAREILHQLQRQHEEKNHILNSERQKEIARLHAEQKELEKQTRLHQEVVKREQELMGQREDDRKRKELNKIEEASHQQELYSLQEHREKSLAILEAKEAEKKQKELERFSNFDKKKDLSQETVHEQKNDYRSRIRGETMNIGKLADIQSQISKIEEPEVQSLVRESQLPRQHLMEITNKNIKGSISRVKTRNKLHPYHRQEIYQPIEAHLTTSSSNQPPLSVYMSKNVSNHHIPVIDLLKMLKNARTIAVLDSFESDIPNVFVGPKNLDSPTDYVKFDLPYLSSIENNRVERKVNKLPFFVAPLSFDPPPGYSKIIFPDPHIGSVVVNSLENIETKSSYNKNSNVIPLIEPNSYILDNEPISIYNTNIPIPYSEESSTEKYDTSSLPPIQLSTEWKFTEFYESRPSTVRASVTAMNLNSERQTSINKFERPMLNRNYYNLNEVSTTPSSYSPKTVTAFSFEQTVPQSTPFYQEKSTRNHEIHSQIINYNSSNNQKATKTYHTTEKKQENSEKYVVDPMGHIVSNRYFLNPSITYEEKVRYNLPAELPVISPHLPGLVNALVEKSEVLSTLQPVTITITNTSISGTETPTTYRSKTRHRSRVTAGRTTTTVSPLLKASFDRVRRPVIRSRFKYTTTAEEYLDSSYDPTKRNSIQTSKYDDHNDHIKKSIIGVSKYNITEDESKESIQTQIVNPNMQSEPSQRGNTYTNLNSTLINSSVVSFRADDTSKVNLNISLFKPDNYSSSAIKLASNFSHRDFEISDSKLPLTGLEFTQKSTQTPNYQMSTIYEQAKLEKQPVNKFNYKPDEFSSISQNIMNFPYYQPEKIDSVLTEPISTIDLSTAQKSQFQDYSSIYRSDLVRKQHRENDSSSPIDHDSNNYNHREELPIFFPNSQNKQERFAYSTSTTEILPETTIRTTSTSSTTNTQIPVTIRQRLRSRLIGRTGQRTDSMVQTQSPGSQDEYVRFRTVNQDSAKASLRERSRPRMGIQHTQRQNSPIQTDGQEYIRIQTVPTQNRKPFNSAITQTTKLIEERINKEDNGFLNSSNKNTQKTNHKNPDLSGGIPVSESNQSQTQILKNRQKHFLTTRRPINTRIATTQSFEDVSYIHSQIRDDQTEEVKPTKAHRFRRPGKRRRTSSKTENTVDANNELLLDENYSRIMSQKSQDLVRNLRIDSYDDKHLILHNHQQSNRNVSKREDDLINENYPQEFLLNYSTTQNFRRDDYNQAQLGSDLPGYYHSTPSSISQSRSTNSRSSSDIYAVESQWSTKLSDNSFQPSKSPNQAINDSNKFLDTIGKENIGHLLDIITAKPDIYPTTLFFTSDDDNLEQKQDLILHTEDSIIDATSNTMVDFGIKLNSENQINNFSTTPMTVISTGNSPLTEANINKNTSPSFKKIGLRRRRVRVRVRPAGSGSENFVTAESQSYDSSYNSLSREMNKFHNFYITTEPTTITKGTVAISTVTESSESDKSKFETIFDKMLDNKEPISTIVPNVSTSIAMISLDNLSASSFTTVSEIVISEDKIMTVQDKNSTITNPPNSLKSLITSNNRDNSRDNMKVPITNIVTMDNTNTYPSISISRVTLSTATQKPEEIQNKSDEKMIQLFNSDNSLRYFVTKSPALNEYLLSQENSQDFEIVEDNLDYPKNHRSKWSEVRYPIDKSFNFTKSIDKKQNQTREERYTEIKQGNDKEAENAYVTDYVKGIFESIKSADKEIDQSTNLASQTTLTSNQDKGFIKIKSSSITPVEIKTSVSSSSTNVTRPEINYNAKQDSSLSITTTESTILSPFESSIMSDKTIDTVKRTPFETNLGNILKTTTTTKVSHMTEICYRGRCVMSKPKKEGLLS